MDCLTNRAVSELKHRRKQAAPGFTLLEVVLAIIIAIGILLVALAFYQQAAKLRAELLLETERISTIRLVMDRISMELRATPYRVGIQKPLTGGSNFLQFVKTSLPTQSAWSGGSLGRVASAESDLKLITYRLQSSDGTNVTGVSRMEEPLVRLPHLADPAGFIDFEDFDAPTPFLISDGVHFMRFRFWTGKAWQESWTFPEPPEGVEVSLAAEAPFVGPEGQEDQTEVFRRVIYLPASQSFDPSLAWATGATNASVNTEVQP